MKQTVTTHSAPTVRPCHRTALATMHKERIREIKSAKSALYKVDNNMRKDFESWIELWWIDEAITDAIEALDYLTRVRRNATTKGTQ